MFPETLCCRLFGSYLNILDGKSLPIDLRIKVGVQLFRFHPELHKEFVHAS